MGPFSLYLGDRVALIICLYAGIGHLRHNIALYIVVL